MVNKVHYLVLDVALISTKIEVLLNKLIIQPYIIFSNASLLHLWFSEGYVSIPGENWNTKIISNCSYLWSSL